MRIIVTGGAGFIASHIADAYVKAGHRVTVLDNLSTGFRRNLNPKANFHLVDIRNLDKVRAIFKKERPEIVNHHAARASVIESVRNPLPTFQTNVLGIVNLLLAFGEYGRGSQRKFIFASTGGAIYGDPKKLPASEKTPVKPSAPYGLSKQLGEDIIKFYARQFGFPYFIFRYTNVYGPRQNPRGEAGIVAIFSALMKSGIRPTIFGDGTKKRDYLYVGDVVHANLIALRRGRNETVNLGWGKLVSDQQIFDALAHAAGFPEKPIYAPFRPGEVYKISLDARKAHRVIGWKPAIPFDAGIKRTVGLI